MSLNLSLFLFVSFIMGKEKKEKKDKAEKVKSEKKHSKEKKGKKDKKDKKEKKEKKDKKEKKSRSGDKVHEENQLSTPATETRDGDLTADDFFLKSEHFRVWCALIKKISFETLSSDEAHKLFDREFCRQFNRRELPDTFYREELPVEMREAALKTKHRWNFKVTGAEADSIQQVADDVDFKTRHATDGAWAHMKTRDNVASSTSSNHPMASMSAPPSHSRRDADDSRDEQRRQQTYERKNFKEYANVVMEELAPKETGRSALQDKRRGVGAELKAAAREREEARDGLDLPDSVVMGGGDDFEAMRARMNRGKDAREAQRIERVRELQEREQQKQASFMAQLGVDLSRGPIRIAPRE